MNSFVPGLWVFVFYRFLEVNVETLKNRKSYVPVTSGLELSVMRENATESNWNQCCNSGCFFPFLFTLFVISLTHVFCLFLYYLYPSFFISSAHPSPLFLHLLSASLLTSWNLCFLLCIFNLYLQTTEEHNNVFFIGWRTWKLAQMMLVAIRKQTPMGTIYHSLCRCPLVHISLAILYC